MEVELLRYIVLFCFIYQDLFHCRLSRRLRISKKCSLNRSELQDVLKKLPFLTAQYPVSSGKTPLITLAKLSANCFHSGLGSLTKPHQKISAVIKYSKIRFISFTRVEQIHIYALRNQSATTKY